MKKWDEWDLLRYVPAIKGVRIVNIGVWKNVNLVFSDDMNIITGNGGTGKSTILRAISACLLPTVLQREYLGDYLKGPGKSRIEVEFLKKKWSCAFSKSHGQVPVATGVSSLGGETYRTLSDFLNQAQKGSAALIDDVTSRLDFDKFTDAYDLIRKADCQKIMVIRRLDSRPLVKNARIFECVYDSKSNSSKLVVRNV